MTVREEGTFVAVSYKLRAGFRVGIGIEAVQRIVFTKALIVFIVFIYLVRCDVKKRFDRVARSDTLQYVYRAENVGFVCVFRIVVGSKNYRLCGKVENYLRLNLVKDFFQMLIIPDVTDNRVDFFADAGYIEHTRIGRRFKRVACDLCACKLENIAKPSTLKACVTCYQNFFLVVK